MAVSIAQGLATVGRSVPILVTGFLSALALWFVFSHYGVHFAPSPQGMVVFGSLPPIHSFVDVQLLITGKTTTLAQALAYAVGLVVFRALLEAFWVGAMLESYAGNRAWGTSWRPSLHRARAALATMLGIEAVSLALTIAAFFVGQSAGLGPLAILIALIGGTYFLILAPAVAGSERLTLGTTLRLSVRAARIRGPRHMMLAFTYLLFALLISELTPGSAIAQATPSVVVWAYVLFVTFLHLSFLAAFCYRWLIVRGPLVGQVQEAPEAERTRPWGGFSRRRARQAP
jgi:hypothetical protein